MQTYGGYEKVKVFFTVIGVDVECRVLSGWVLKMCRTVSV